MLTLSECLPRKTFCRHGCIYGIVPILALLSRGDPGTKRVSVMGQDHTARECSGSIKADKGVTVLPCFLCSVYLAQIPPDSSCPQLPPHSPCRELQGSFLSDFKKSRLMGMGRCGGKPSRQDKEQGSCSSKLRAF